MLIIYDLFSSSNYFLTEPNPSEFDENNRLVYDRIVLPYRNIDRFFIPKNNRTHQFFGIYEHRLDVLGVRIKDKLLKLNVKCPINDKILNIEKMQTCIIIGTLYKQMSLKPSILKEYTEQRAILNVPENQKFTSPEDTLFLEDDAARIQLDFSNFEASKLITGIVMGIKGMQMENGHFKVDEFYFPGCLPQPSIPLNNGNRRFVLITSGLYVGSSKYNPFLNELLCEYITGDLCSPKEEEVNSKIFRVILAGNSFANDFEGDNSNIKDFNKKYSKEEQDKYLQNVKELDNLLYRLTKSIDVDLMPGAYDPTNYAFPQQKLNKWLLPLSSSNSSFHFATNPYESVIDGITFLGHSGQPFKNATSYMDCEDPLDYLEQTLEWGHIAPMGPSTLSTIATDRDFCIIGMCY